MTPTRSSPGSSVSPPSSDMFSDSPPSSDTFSDSPPPSDMASDLPSPSDMVCDSPPPSEWLDWHWKYMQRLKETEGFDFPYPNRSLGYPIDEHDEEEVVRAAKKALREYNNANKTAYVFGELVSATFMSC